MPRRPYNPNIQHERRVGMIGRPLAPSDSPQAVARDFRPRLTTLTPPQGQGDGVPLQVVTVDLSTARTTDAPLQLQLRGNVFIVNASTFASDLARVRFNGAGGWVTVAAGWQGYGNPFELVEVINDAQAGSSLELVYAADPDNRLWFRYR